MHNAVCIINYIIYNVLYIKYNANVQTTLKPPCFNANYIINLNDDANYIKTT